MRGDEEKDFFSYGHDEQNSKSLHSYAKKDAECCHLHMFFKNIILNEQHEMKEFSALFYYLPSTTDRKEKINKFKENVKLNLIDSSLEFLDSFSSDELFSFRLEYLTSAILDLRDLQVQMLYKFFSHMSKVSNDNLIWNTNNLLAKNTNINTINMQMVGPSRHRYDPSKFKLTY